MSENIMLIKVNKPFNTRQRRFVAGDWIEPGTKLLPHDQQDLIKRRVLKNAPALKRAGTKAT